MLVIAVVSESIMGQPPLQDKLSTATSRFQTALRQSPELRSYRDGSPFVWARYTEQLR
jgi:hypothetical protein